MNLLDLGQWRPYVVPSAPGVSEMEFRFALRRAAREFCRLAWVWKTDWQTFDIMAGQSRYTPTLPTDSEVARVLEAKSPEGSSKGLDECTHEQANFIDQTQTGGPPTAYNLADNRVIRLAPVPSTAATAGLSAYFALKPTRDAEQLPEILLDDYAEGLAAGALWYLTHTPDKPYSNPPAAQDHRTSFYGYINQASVDAARGFARTFLEVVPSW